MPTALNSIDLPQTQNVVITQADSFELVFQVTDENGDGVALTGLQGSAEVRDRPGGAVLATLTVVVDQSGASLPTTGYVTVSATGADMDSAISGVYDVEIHDGTPTFVFRKTIVTGSFSTTPQVTES